MYEIKKKYRNRVAMYAMKTKLDINGIYTKEEWNRNGFKDSILEKVNRFEDYEKLDELC